MLYLVFDTQQDAESALQTIYANMILIVDSPDLLNIETQHVDQKDQLNEQQLIQVNSGYRHYPVFGKNAGTGLKLTDAGYTLSWATPAQRVTDGKWVFIKPSDGLMNAVVYSSEEEYDPAWFPGLDGL